MHAFPSSRPCNSNDPKRLENLEQYQEKAEPREGKTKSRQQLCLFQSMQRCATQITKHLTAGLIGFWQSEINMLNCATKRPKSRFIHHEVLFESSSVDTFNVPPRTSTSFFAFVSNHFMNSAFCEGTKSISSLTLEV